MPLVIGVDRVEGLRRLRQRREPEQAFAIRQVGARAGVLYHGRLAAREIAGRPVADPRVLEFHEERFGAAPLAARGVDVGLIGLWRAGDVAGRSDAPPVPLEELLV